MAALRATLAPTLRRLVVDRWRFGTEGCAEEWPQLRSLEVRASDTLARALGPVRLPRLERLAVYDLRAIYSTRGILPHVESHRTSMEGTAGGVARAAAGARRGGLWARDAAVSHSGGCVYFGVFSGRAV